VIRVVARRASLVVGALAFGVGALACGGGALETATEMPKAPRRPDGVVLEPPPAVPQAQERATTSSAVLALREPPLAEDVEEVVRAYLRAFEREDLEGLTQLLAQDAAPIGRVGGRSQLLDLWRGRFKSFEYQKLAGAEVARFGQLERRSYDAYAVPAAAGGPATSRPAEMRPGDLLVRVPIATPRVGGEQLFGDVLVLLLRREDGKLRIAGQADESAP
jgi:hypothetical protein